MHSAASTSGPLYIKFTDSLSEAHRAPSYVKCCLHAGAAVSASTTHKAEWVLADPKTSGLIGRAVTPSRLRWQGAVLCRCACAAPERQVWLPAARRS